MSSKALSGVYSLSRGSWPLVAMFVVGWLSAMGYLYGTRSEPAPASLSGRLARESLPERATDAIVPVVDRAPAEQTRQAAAASTAEPDPAIQWAADAIGNDSAARASAIVSLANAPKSQALPVLQKVLTSGEPQVDRPLALKSLRTLALTQGDTDSSIRNVLREAIYHSGDEATTQGAQSILDDVEAAVSKAAPPFIRQR